jgi:hypothetical protein
MSNRHGWMMERVEKTIGVAFCVMKSGFCTYSGTYSVGAEVGTKLKNPVPTEGTNEKKSLTDTMYFRQKGFSRDLLLE